jgi:fumarylacetoacetase
MMADIDETHDPARTSWVESAAAHPHFPIQNLPFGIFSVDGEAPRGGIAIGDDVLDLRALVLAGLLDGDATVAAQAGSEATLNSLLRLGSGPRRELRRQVSALLSDTGNQELIQPLLVDMASARMHLPTRIGDYTDFYVGIHHATNVGRLFRPDMPLMLNYKYIPIGYHGRASSVRPSGAELIRPGGQRKVPQEDRPVFGSSRRLDYELELGIWVSDGNALGRSIPIADAWNHVAGISLLNDWSARDIQAWEYQPLGPFLAKNFMTTVSPWIVTSEALAPFQIAQPQRPEGDPDPLPYLWDNEDQTRGALSLTLEVFISTQKMRDDGLPAFRLSRGPASNMYWTIGQMVTHHTSNGCDLHPGDLIGSGTISGPQKDSFGSLLEISRNGMVPVDLPSGEQRNFLEDGDEIIITGQAITNGFVSIGLGSCVGRILPSLV